LDVRFVPIAEVARSVELIVQTDAKDAVGVLALGPAKRIINDVNVGRALTLLLGHACHADLFGASLWPADAPL